MKRYFLLCIFLFCVPLFFYGCSEPNESEENLKEKDTNPPIINFMAENPLIIEKGTDFDYYEGVYGIDDVDKNITNRIEINFGNFNKDKTGEYTIVYSLSDSSGNEAEEVMRKIIVIDKENLKLVAHRGGKGVGLENTKEAFQNAIKEGYYGLECDIQTTKDSKIVVYHDLNIERLTGVNAKVSDCTFEYLSSLTLTKIEDGVTCTGQIMLFKEYLQLVKDSSCVAFIELKESFTMNDVRQTLEEIQAVGLSKDQYVFIANSCSIDLLVEIRKLDQNVKLQFVANTEYEKYMEKCLQNRIDLDVSYSVFARDYDMALNYVKAFQKAGLEVNIWVVNSMRDLDKCLLIGANYLTTDKILPSDLKK